MRTSMLKKGGLESRAWRHTFMKQQLELFVKPLLLSLSRLVRENSMLLLSFSLPFIDRFAPDAAGVGSALITPAWKVSSSRLLFDAEITERSQEKSSGGT